MYFLLVTYLMKAIYLDTSQEMLPSNLLVQSQSNITMLQAIFLRFQSTSLKSQRTIVFLVLRPQFGTRSPHLSDARKYNSGAIGSLTHSLLLHGEKYETQLSVFADGYTFRLVDLYTHPKLFVRYFPCFLPSFF